MPQNDPLTLQKTHFSKGFMLSFRAAGSILFSVLATTAKRE
jgi:hypothetical protein